MICDVAVSIFNAALFLNSPAGCRLALELTRLTVILLRLPNTMIAVIAPVPNQLFHLAIGNLLYFDSNLFFARDS